MGSSSGKSIKKKLKEIPEVLPYKWTEDKISELNNVDLNFEKLLDLCANNYENEKKEYVENKNLETEKKLINIDIKDLKNNQFADASAPKDNKNMTNYFEKVFSENERKYLRRMFLTYSSDGVK